MDDRPSNGRVWDLPVGYFMAVPVLMDNTVTTGRSAEMMAAHASVTRFALLLSHGVGRGGSTTARSPISVLPGTRSRVRRDRFRRTALPWHNPLADGWCWCYFRHFVSSRSGLFATTTSPPSVRCTLHQQGSERHVHRAAQANTAHLRAGLAHVGAVFELARDAASTWCAQCSPGEGVPSGAPVSPLLFPDGSRWLFVAKQWRMGYFHPNPNPTEGRSELIIPHLGTALPLPPVSAASPRAEKPEDSIRARQSIMVGP